MDIYDSHADIFYDLWQKHLQGINDPFGKYHLENLTKGGVKGGIWVVYSDEDFDVLEAYRIALEEYAPYRDRFDVIYGLEGLRNVKDLAAFDHLYQMGIRHAMLTWNEANHLATGVLGNPNRGLTPEGKEFLHYMESKKMIVDLSHLNEKSFYEVLATTNKNIIASHSNAYRLCPHLRNLTDEQMKAIAEVDGVIGVVAARNFVSFNRDLQNVKGLVDHIDYISNLIGVEHVMLGLDFMNYLGNYNNSNLDDLKNASDLSVLIKEMEIRGYHKEEIEAICYKNYIKVKEKVYEKSTSN